MALRISVPHCPSCGAPLAVPEGVARVPCGFCGALLVVEATRVTAHRDPRPADPGPDALAPLVEPDASLLSHVAPRFELSLLEQRVPGAPDEIFTHLELPGGAFAFAALRAVDVAHGRPVPVDLGPAFAALCASLTDDLDPGLAANLALEALCTKGFAHRLEVAVLLFEPHRMRVTPYLAGPSFGATWLSSEEARTITLDGRREGLQRTALREQGSHFDNGRAVFLAAHDVVVLPSPALFNRGGPAHGNFEHDFHEVARAHLGEEPLRLVTLLKNRFWAELGRHRDRQAAPLGHVRLAAVRALVPPAFEGDLPGLEARAFTTPAFELAALCAPGDHTQLHPLHDGRHVLVHLSRGGDRLEVREVDAATAAILAVLDRRDHGDNENPREAGRQALAALGAGTAVTVLQTIDRHGRLKYFREGFAQALALGPRGVRTTHELQAFDGGGEATVVGGARLLFPGTLPLDGEGGTLPARIERWPGGKASRLYEAATAHWKTRRTPRALEGLARAALGDLGPACGPGGLFLVTGLQEG